MATGKKFIVRVGTGPDKEYVVKVRSFANPQRGYVASELTKDSAKARVWSNLAMAQSVAKRNKGTVVEIGTGTGADASDGEGDEQ